MKRQHPERRLHIAVADTLRAVLPLGWRWTTNAAGEFRTARTAGLLERMGVQPGWADIQILLPDGRTGYIELKRPEGRAVVSPAQGEFAATCAAFGAPYALCRSVDDVRAALDAWGVQTREQRVAA